jgi:hypothetical protein
MNSAFSTSPFSGVAAYNPSTPLAASDVAVAALGAVNTALNYLTDYSNMVSAIGTNPNVAAEILAFDAGVDWNIANVILPRFQRGMQDINAVYSSSFVLGEALVEAQGTIQ